MIEIRHTGLYVENIELMKDFYVQMFGMAVSVHETECSDYIAAILGLEQAKVELYKLTADDGSMLELLKLCNVDMAKKKKMTTWEQGNHHIAVTVLDIELEYIKLKKNGIQFVSQPCKSPNGYAKVCFCEDPEGNYVELVEVL